MKDGKHLGRFDDKFELIFPSITIYIDDGKVTNSHGLDIKYGNDNCVSGVFDEKTNKVFSPTLATLIHLGAHGM